MAAPAGTVTFLFSDIQGSTRLLAQLGYAYATVLADQRRILRDIFARRNGHEVDTQGDAFFVAFSRAQDAVVAAVEAQQALAGYSGPQDASVRVRMGLHTGEPLLAETGYVGMDVHRAARICATGHGGQVLLSETTLALVGMTLPDGVSYRALGEHCLKDLAHPQPLYQLLIPGLPADFPPLKSLGALPNNLPLQLTSFVVSRLTRRAAPHAARCGGAADPACRKRAEHTRAEHIVPEGFRTRRPTKMQAHDLAPLDPLPVTRLALPCRGRPQPLLSSAP